MVYRTYVGQTLRFHVKNGPNNILSQTNLLDSPELIFVVGCNAAGKSSFIRTRLNELLDFEIIMTDVSKGRTKDVIQNALNERKNIEQFQIFLCNQLILLPTFHLRLILYRCRRMRLLRFRLKDGS